MEWLTGKLGNRWHSGRDRDQRIFLSGNGLFELLCSPISSSEQVCVRAADPSLGSGSVRLRSSLRSG
jgi:hypothetical protein